MELKMLGSVGSFIDLESGYTYPAKRTENVTKKVSYTPDLDQPCHLDDIENDEFFENLSDEDNQTIKVVQERKLYDRTVCTLKRDHECGWPTCIKPMCKYLQPKRVQPNRNDLSTQLY